ncbi:hypothetical protein Q7C36_017885 [Tachysurus vachellii]|uniref:Uncharacterized protein n=1 Tax=Tachysurus vachellii TaxID=175792 RepID=A0AA88LYV6_TACVA|nr:hypothetical protein Q7C36_017885 [Tachysurus vachellii]
MIGLKEEKGKEKNLNENNRGPSTNYEVEQNKGSDDPPNQQQEEKSVQGNTDTARVHQSVSCKTAVFSVDVAPGALIRPSAAQCHLPCRAVALDYSPITETLKLPLEQGANVEPLLARSLLADPKHDRYERRRGRAELSRAGDTCGTLSAMASFPAAVTWSTLSVSDVISRKPG